MNEEDKKHLQNLVVVHKKRLRVLELQAAEFGLHSPPHIHTEIDEIRNDIERFESLLSQNVIYSLPEGKEVLTQYIRSIDNVENLLRNVELRVDRTYRIFGIPIFSSSVVFLQIFKILLPAVGIGIIALLLGIAVLTTRPQYTQGYSLSCSADERELNVIIKGNARPNTPVDLYLDGKVLNSSTADATGNYTFTLTLPPNIPPAPDGYQFTMKAQRTSEILGTPACGGAFGGPGTPITRPTP
jgi:hypothetical protein